MAELNINSKYTIDKDLKTRLDKIFHAEYVTEDETKLFINRVYESFKYLLDTHSAVSIAALSKYRGRTKDLTPVLSAATASPYKFTSSVLEALELPTEGLDDFAQINLLNKKTTAKVPKNLAVLNAAQVLHNDVCDKDEMPQRVLDFAAQ